MSQYSRKKNIKNCGVLHCPLLLQRWAQTKTDCNLPGPLLSPDFRQNRQSNASTPHLDPHMPIRQNIPPFYSMFSIHPIVPILSDTARIHSVLHILSSCHVILSDLVMSLCHVYLSCHLVIHIYTYQLQTKYDYIWIIYM